MLSNFLPGMYGLPCYVFRQDQTYLTPSGCLHSHSSLAVRQERWAINVGLREAVKPAFWLLKSIDLSNAPLLLLYGSDSQNTSQRLLFPSILLFIFLPAHNLLFSSTEPGHVSPPVLLVSAPPACPRILLQPERERQR